MKKIHFIILFCCIISANLYAQINGISLGVQAGFGDIKGKAISESTFGINGFIELSPDFWNIVDFRFDYSYMRQIESLFPEKSQKKYYPSIHAFSLKAITRQIVSPVLFLEEGLGLLALIDKTYSDYNEWDYGVSGLVALGMDFKNSENFPVTLSIGANFGLTFTNTTASYMIYHLQLQYFLLN